MPSTPIDVQIRIHIDPPVPHDLHIHLDVTPPDPRLDQIIQLLQEANLSELSARFDALDAAIAAMKDVVSVDVAHLMDIIAQLTAQSTADAATIAAFQADAAAASGRIDAAISSVSSEDPDPSFPPTTPGP